MKIGFLFAGQGSQYVGMGKELYETYDEVKQMYDKVKSTFDIKDVCFNGPQEKLNNTLYAQPSIFLTSMAIAKVLELNNISANYCAGLSLGEYAALCYSNVFSIEEGIEIVSKRGSIMEQALPKGTSGMLAILGLDVELIKEACSKVNGICEIANFNCPGQIVVTGETNSLEEVTPILQEMGARRVIPLAVSGAFHSSLLIDASNKLEQALSNYILNKPDKTVVYNVTGTPSNDSIISLLKRQICNSVYFMQSIEYMINEGVDTFIEIGPGKTLIGFVRKISKEVSVYNVEDIKSLNKLMEVINNG